MAVRRLTGELQQRKIDEAVELEPEWRPPSTSVLSGVQLEAFL